jgi:phage tail-like protein
MPIVDPLASYSYAVEITGLTIAQFKEVSGLAISVGVIENRANVAGGLPLLQKMPGAIKYDDIHLSRGKVADPAFWDWIKMVQEGKIDQARKDGAVVLFDYAHGEVTRFNFFGAWPTRLALGNLSAGAESFLLESVTIAIERLEVK